MTDISFSIYMENTINLCRTLVIKSDKTAEAVNNGLAMAGWPIEEDPHKWKYYLNISGEYHDSDEVMVVRSHDTLEDIVFNKENLAVHKATKQQYTLLGSYYEALVDKYPTQELLIRSILSPIDIDEAIDADEYTILDHDSSYIEEQEENLLSSLQEWIYSTMHTNEVPGYYVTDGLYLPAILGVLYSNLPLEVMAIRLKNCHTPYTHSYHMWNYLSGHLALDDFKTQLTLDQAKWLYRDVRYIEENRGKEKIFDTIIEKLFTDRNLSVFGFNLLTDSSTILDSYRPDIKVERFSLNGVYDVDKEVSLDDMMGMSLPLAIHNTDMRETRTEEIANDLTNSLYTKHDTRVLEVIGTDDTNSLPYSLEDILGNEWIRWACERRYYTSINVPNPYSGETLALTPKDALIVWIYCYNRSQGIELSTMPDLLAFRTFKIDRPTISELRSDLDDSLLSLDLATSLLEESPLIGTYNNVEDFNNACTEIYNFVVSQREIVSDLTDYRVQGEAKVFVEKCFEHYLGDMESTNIYEWMNGKGIDLTELSREDSADLANEVIQAVTGNYNDAEETLTRLQTAMISIAERITSYDIQWNRTTNIVNIKKTDWPTIKPGEDRVRLKHSDRFDPSVEVQNLNARMLKQVNDAEPVTLSEITATHYTYGKHSLDVGLEVSVSSTPIVADARVAVPIISTKIIEGN